jgi:hypothetical protein
MSTRIVSAFEVTSWEQAPYDEPEGGPSLLRATVNKVFAGEVEGISTAELLMCRPTANEAGYVGSERFIGRIGEKSGSFVIQHGATQDGEAFNLFGNIVPGSGTDELSGIRGSATFRHDAGGAIFTLEYDFK